MIAVAILSNSSTSSAKSSERGKVWMTSSSSWPGNDFGSRPDLSSAATTRREMTGISSTFAFIAATVNSPTSRCSIASLPALSRTTTT